jgi:hypothetical protein
VDEKTRKPWVNPKVTRLLSGSAELLGGLTPDGGSGLHS